MVSDSGSANADAASENETECFFRFDDALSGSHSKLIIAMTESPVGLPIGY